MKVRSSKLSTSLTVGIFATTAFISPAVASASPEPECTNELAGDKIRWPCTAMTTLRLLLKTE